MLPAHQRLDAGQPARGQVDDRLVVHDELVAGQRVLAAASARRPRAGCRRTWPGRTRRTGRGRPPWPSTSRGRRRAAARRLVGLGPSALVVATPMLAVPTKSRLPSRTGWRIAASSRSARAAASISSTSSTSTANSSPPSRASVSDGRTCWLIRSATRRDELVAGRVAERVVDHLEVVEVDQQQRHSAAAALVAGHRVLDPVAEQRPVGQAGQRVLERLAGQLALERLLLGHVADAQDDRVQVGVGQPVGAGHLDLDPAAVGPAGTRLHSGRRPGRRLAYGGDPLADGGQLVRVGDRGEPLDGQPLRLVAEDPPHRAAGEDDAAVGDREDRVGGVFQQRHRAPLGGLPLTVLAAAILGGLGAEPDDGDHDDGHGRNVRADHRVLDGGQAEIAGGGQRTDLQHAPRAQHGTGGHQDDKRGRREDRQPGPVAPAVHEQQGQVGNVPADQPVPDAGAADDPLPVQQHARALAPRRPRRSAGSTSAAGSASRTRRGRPRAQSGRSRSRCRGGSVAPSTRPRAGRRFAVAVCCTAL